MRSQHRKDDAGLSNSQRYVFSELRRSMSAHGAPASAKASARSRRSSKSEGGSAGRAEKCTSGDCLTMAAPAWVARAPVHNQLGNRVIRASVANRCLRGRQRLRCIFRTYAPRWPHRAAARHAPPQPAKPPPCRSAEVPLVKGKLDVAMIPGRHPDVLKEPPLARMARQPSNVLDALAASKG